METKWETHVTAVLTLKTLNRSALSPLVDKQKNSSTHIAAV